MIEWHFGLPPLSVRDDTANNLAEVLNLAAPNVSAPAFAVPSGPFGSSCVSAASGPTTTDRAKNLQKLRARAIKSGFQGVH